MGTLHWLAQFLHPGKVGPGGGYWWWSGLGSDLGEVTIFAAVIGIYRHRACHIDRCWRLGHPDPEHGFPACRRHHSRRDRIGKP